MKSPKTLWHDVFNGESRIAAIIAVVCIGLTISLFATRDSLKRDVEDAAKHQDYKSLVIQQDQCHQRQKAWDVAHKRTEAMRDFVQEAINARKTASRLAKDKPTALANMQTALNYENNILPRLVDSDYPQCHRIDLQVQALDRELNG